jgi:cell division protease FtsH
VDDELEHVRQLLTDNRERLDALAEALLERETLDELDAYAVAGISREREPASA